MGRQARGKKPEKLGTGKVTPVQVAFIVDRYLAENHYTKALAEFRSEAASVLGVAQPRQVTAFFSFLSFFAFRSGCSTRGIGQANGRSWLLNRSDFDFC